MPKTPFPNDLFQRLVKYNQAHLTAGWDELSPAEQKRFLNQLYSINYEELDQLFQSKDQGGAVLPDRAEVEPLPVVSSESLGAEELHAGEAELMAGRVAALVVAGGQGSRLGFEHPKGMFPIGPVSSKSLFQLHAEKVLALSRRYGKPIPLLVMTSPATHEPTVEFFRTHQNFQLQPEQVHFFMQGTMPAVDLATGKLLLEAPGRLFLSPNGHGGTLTALADSQLLNHLEQQGIRSVFYFQVDNPMVKICDPKFLGKHLLSRSEVSSKVVYKENPLEKVGLLAVVKGRCEIIEYSDLPQSWAEERDEQGELKFRTGNTAIHIFDLEFLRKITTGEQRLAFHLARKKVPYFDQEAKVHVEPREINALKFELFIFDALPLAERWLAVSTPRDEEFAPVKNATGADSPETARRAMIKAYAKQLLPTLTLPRDEDGNPLFPVEISPLCDLNRTTMPGCLTGPLYFDK